MTRIGTRIGTRIIVTLLFATVLAGVAAAQEDRTEALPPELQGLPKMQPVIGTKLPLDLPFVDEKGRKIRLRDYFDGDKPVLMTLGYYRCPLLCDLSLNEVVKSLREIDLDPGEDFEMVTVSIDPLETPTLAKEKKQSYLATYGRPSAARGWHFLTGKEADIAELSTNVSFPFRWMDRTKEYVHDVGIYLFTPDGTLSRCLKVARNSNDWYPARSIRLGLIEASEGELGTFVDGLSLWCFHFDPDQGAYTMQAFRIM
ncbi:MAG: SCO family protein, partial [Planctomycetota bacterium]